MPTVFLDIQKSKRLKLEPIEFDLMLRALGEYQPEDAEDNRIMCDLVVKIRKILQKEP